VAGNDGAGVVALVVFSGVALFFAVVGIVPPRLAIGDKSIDTFTEEVIDTVDQAAPLLPIDTLRKLASATLTAAGEGTPTQGLVAKRLSEHLLFEEQVLSAVRSVAGKLGARVRITGAEDSTWDAKLVLKERVAYVEARLTLDVAAATRIRSTALATPPIGCVIVVVRDADEQAIRQLAVPRALTVLKWNGDFASIEALIEAALVE
jgi:hypothetical protein